MAVIYLVLAFTTYARPPAAYARSPAAGSFRPPRIYLNILRIDLNPRER